MIKSTEQQAFYFLRQKIWTKVSRNTKNVKTTASFLHALKTEIFSNQCRQMT